LRRCYNQVYATFGAVLTTIQEIIGQIKREITGLVNNDKGMFELEFRDDYNHRNFFHWFGG